MVEVVGVFGAPLLDELGELVEVLVVVLAG